VHANIVQPEFATYRVRAAAKYASNGSTPIIMASGVEARLIEAEALLQKNDPEWLVKLNDLRATCTPGSACSPVLVSMSGVQPLPQIVDPGTKAAEVDTLFRERAAWLYLTGHRQGDMRRLIRQYPGRQPNTVYPIGPYPLYPGGDLRYTQYGSDITMPPPESERTVNPKYSGCLTRGA
jgi:hypothetical protein